MHAMQDKYVRSRDEKPGLNVLKYLLKNCKTIQYKREKNLLVGMHVQSFCKVVQRNQKNVLFFQNRSKNVINNKSELLIV